MIPTQEQVVSWFDCFKKRGSNYAVLQQNQHEIDIAIEMPFCVYHIGAKWDNDEGYMGCIAKVKGGGMNDLPDGPLNRDTWLAILEDIIAYELGVFRKYA